MKRLILSVAWLVAANCAPAWAQELADIEGVWTGAWYRGMTSGTLRLKLGEGSGTIQFAGVESFGIGVQPLRVVRLAGRTLSLQAVGEAGAPFTATFTLQSPPTELRGTGSYENLAYRFELRRVAP